MRFPRSSGLLLHPTALPGPAACGDLGDAAHTFVDFLADAGQAIWQVLPLGVTGHGDSPYQCFSAFAGNPMLVSAARLHEQGLLDADTLARLPARREASDFGAAFEATRAVAASLATSLERGPRADAFEAYRARTPWLADFALFMALHDAHPGRVWREWPEPIRRRDPGALATARRALGREIREHEVMQWAFDVQWRELRAHANARGVAILGDAPIFVAFDSADLWAHPELFELDAEGRPQGLAGVPPDYFTALGQLWGNPLYDWPAHARDGYGWWGARLQSLLGWVDRVRLDHFIGFVRFWDVPPDAPDARAGRWRPGPGEALFLALERRLGALPFVAEDLGETGDDVTGLRDTLDLAGMCVLQFAFDGDPDNATTLGWWTALGDDERRLVRNELGTSTDDIAWDLISAGMRSRADTFVTPVQDVLSLGTEARFNTPGVGSGNWTWRLGERQLTPAHAERLRDLAIATGRARARD
jgi:4-alpha-glucanotransferase